MSEKEMIVVPLELFVTLTEIACEHNYPIAGTAVDLKNKWNKIGPVTVPCTLVTNELLSELQSYTRYSPDESLNDKLVGVMYEQDVEDL